MRTKRKYTKRAKEQTERRDSETRPEVEEKYVPKKPPVVEPEEMQAEPANELDAEDVPESEANAMVERAAKRREAEREKIEASVDNQDWSQSDPLIPEDLKGKVWIAVYKCPEGHKTKATNRQAKSGVRCAVCRGQGKTVKADVMPQFLEKPVEPDSDDIKRKQAAKGKS